MAELKIVNGKIPKSDWLKFKKKLVDDGSNASEFIRQKVTDYITTKKKKHD